MLDSVSWANATHEEKLLDLLEAVGEFKCVEISHAFWWESNACWGDVTCKADWILMIFRWSKDNSYRGSLREAQEKMLTAHKTPREDSLQSFGFRGEHICNEPDKQPTLRDWLLGKAKT